MRSSEERLNDAQVLMESCSQKTKDIKKLEALKNDIWGKIQDARNEVPKLKKEIVKILTPYSKNEIIKITSPLGKIKYYRINFVNIPTYFNSYNDEWNVNDLRWELSLKRLYKSSKKESSTAIKYYCNVDGVPQGKYKLYYGRKRYDETKSFLDMGSWEVVEKVSEETKRKMSESKKKKKENEEND